MATRVTFLLVNICRALLTLNMLNFFWRKVYIYFYFVSFFEIDKKKKNSEEARTCLFYTFSVMSGDVLGWGLLKLCSLISPLRNFFFQNYLLCSLNHIHVWWVSPQGSCGDTYQIWKIMSIFDCGEKLGNNGIEEIALVTPTPVKQGARASTRMALSQLTHCGLVMLYGDIDLGQHWLR